LQLKVIPNSFDTLIPGLSSKRYDAVISGVTINDQRKQEVDFVPYFSAGETLMVQNGNPEHIRSLADVCGKAVAVQNGTVEQPDLQFASETCRKEGKPSVNIQVLEDQNQVIQDLANRRVSATFQDSPVTDYYLKQHPGKFEIGGSVMNAALIGIAVRKGDSAMLKAVKDALYQMKRDGSYKALIDKWGLTSGEII
jgi:polar amino acid transport system substrate-binding protein